MQSEKENKPSVIVEDGEMENIELHRAESLVGAEPPIELKTLENETNKNVFVYVGHGAKVCCSEISHLKVEAVMFLYMFSYVLRSISSTTMIMDKVCSVHLGYSDEICANLDKNETIKDTVEKITNNYHLGHTLIQMLPSAILCCFIGSWSDTYGRKPPIIVALVGIILDGIGATICASFMRSRVEYYFISAIFTGISGGFISVLTVLYSYASDITTYSKRTMKYAFMEMAFGLAMPLGSLAGGWIFKFFGYVPVFLTSTAGHVLGLVWVLLFIQETRGMDKTDPWSVKFRKLWSTESVISSYKATVKPRPNKGKMQIILLIAAMSFAVVSFASTANVSFLYVHHMYDWGNTTFSTVSAIFAVMSTISMLIAVPLFRKFGLGDPTLGIVGSISLILKNVGIGVAYRRGIYMLANLLGILASLLTLAGRSRISKVASENDLGKIFSFVTTAESIVPIMSTALVSQIYNATLEAVPGLVFITMGLAILFPLGVFIWLARLPNVNYEEMNGSQKEDTKEMKDPTKA